MRIIVDTREQKPLSFECESARGTLHTGDYSIEGYEESFCVERKSIGDLIGTCDNKNRDRFRRECERMRSYRFYALVIDGSANDVREHCKKLYKTQLKQYNAKLKRGYRGRAPMRPETRALSVLGTINALRTDYNLHYYFTSSREASSELIESFAKSFTRSSKNNTNR